MVILGSQNKITDFFDDFRPGPVPLNIVIFTTGGYPRLRAKHMQKISFKSAISNSILSSDIH